MTAPALHHAKRTNHSRLSNDAPFVLQHIAANFDIPIFNGRSSEPCAASFTSLDQRAAAAFFAMAFRAFGVIEAARAVRKVFVIYLADKN